jgi:hypothetical protein
MALTSTCLKCGNSFFEVKVMEPHGSRYKVIVLRCAGCGGVAGLMDFLNIGSQTEAILDRLEKLERKLR